MRGKFVLVNQDHLLNSGQVPLDKFSPWFTLSKALAAHKGHPVHAKSFTLGKARSRTWPFESTGSDVPERDVEILLLDTLAGSKKSRVIFSSGNVPHSNLHAIISPCSIRLARIQDLKALLSLSDVKDM